MSITFSIVFTHISVLAPHQKKDSETEYLASCTSPYSGDSFEAAYHELTYTDHIVMHAHLWWLFAISAVFLTRRIVAADVVQLVYNILNQYILRLFNDAVAHQ